MRERPPKRLSGSDDKSKEIVCLCNEITRAQIEDAIKTGCDTMGKIFDRTTAGVGPCGGSCRRYLEPMLDQYRETGKFSEYPVRPVPPKKQRGR